MNIADTLKKYRKEARMTQDEVSKKLFVTRQAISNWERGKTIPDIDKLLSLSELYDIDVNKLLLDDVKQKSISIRIRTVILLVLSIILLGIMSVKTYRMVNPLHKDILSAYEGVCIESTSDITRYEYLDSDGDYYEVYTMYDSVPVRFEFGAYCIPTFSRIEIFEKDFKNASLEVKSEVYGTSVLVNAGYIADRQNTLDIVYRFSIEVPTIVNGRVVNIREYVTRITEIPNGLDLEVPYDVSNVYR